MATAPGSQEEHLPVLAGEESVVQQQPQLGSDPDMARCNRGISCDLSYLFYLSNLVSIFSIKGYGRWYSEGHGHTSLFLGCSRDSAQGGAWGHLLISRWQGVGSCHAFAAVLVWEVTTIEKGEPERKQKSALLASTF